MTDGSGTILVVDDEPEMRELLRDVLQERGRPDNARSRLDSLPAASVEPHPDHEGIPLGITPRNRSVMIAKCFRPCHNLP